MEGINGALYVQWIIPARAINNRQGIGNGHAGDNTPGIALVLLLATAT